MDRVRPMTKVNSLRDMKREVRGSEEQKACKNLLEIDLILFD